MCGIGGIAKSKELTDDELLCGKTMLKVLSHRGPDDQALYTDKNCLLAHRRLSIIDLAAGKQPLCNEDKTIWIVFNGEIYNFSELREYLLSKGHQFQTHSDTETIIHLYEEKGAECVNDLQGMFAFAIWDTKEKKLMLARDRLGIKPLYYLHDGDRLVFGSEIKAILAAPGIAKKIDYESLFNYLTYLYVPGPKSIFQNICKLEPGNFLILKNKQLITRQYWDVRFTPELNISENKILSRLKEQLYESVKMRLISDVPLGAFLSGGIDSSSVVAFMAGIQEKPIITNTVGFEEQSFNEAPYARLVAERFHTHHHEFFVRPNSLNILDKLAWHYDEPFADYSAIPTYYVSQNIRKVVKVALSGDGGDENFAGYKRYFYNQKDLHFRQKLPWPLRHYILKPLGQIYPQAEYLPRFLRFKSRFQKFSQSDERAYFSHVSSFSSGFSRNFLRPEISKTLNGYDPFSVLERHFKKCDSKDFLSRILYVDIKTYLADDILTKVDRASMAVSLEVRVPILDHKFVEYCARIPSYLKLHNGEGKYIFKRLMRPILGNEIIDRPKMGFSVPLGNWFRGPLREFIQDIMLNPNAMIFEWIDEKKLKHIWKLQQQGTPFLESTIWAILMLELWANRFLSTSNSLI